MTREPVDFEEAIQLARAGDQAGFSRLWVSFSPRVAGYVRGRCHVNDVDDVTSRVFLELFHGLDRFEGGESRFVALLFTIARRRAIDEHRRRRRIEPESQELDPVVDHPDPRPGPEEDTMGREEMTRVLDRLRTLTTVQRDVVLLRVLGGLTIEEVAGVLGRSPGAVTQLQHRAFKRLRAELLGAQSDQRDRSHGSQGPEERGPEGRG